MGFNLAFKGLSDLADFRETWYERYATGCRPQVVLASYRQ